MILIQLDHNQIYVCLIQITVTNSSETRFNIIFHCVIRVMLRIWVFWDVMLAVWRFPLFQRNVLSSSSSVKYCKAPCWRRYVPLKCYEPLTAQHFSITSQSTQILSSITMKTSNLIRVFYIFPSVSDETGYVRLRTCCESHWNWHSKSHTVHKFMSSIQTSAVKAILYKAQMNFYPYFQKFMCQIGWNLVQKICT